MSDPFDPYGPLTPLGKTPWGSLIRGEKERALRAEKSVRQASEYVKRVQRAERGHWQEQQPNYKDVNNRVTLLFPPVRRTRSAWDKWLWDLSDTLTELFDKLAETILNSKTWRGIVIIAVFAMSFAALALFPASRFLSSAGSVATTTTWAVSAAIFAAGGLCGWLAPYLLVFTVRCVLWMVGELVTLAARISIIAAIVSAIVAGIWGAWHFIAAIA